MVRFKYRTLLHLFKILVDTYVDVVYLGVSKKEKRYEKHNATHW